MATKSKLAFDRICVDCRYYAAQPGKAFPACNRQRNVVTGEVMKCTPSSARSRNGFCGPGGHYFEAAQKQLVAAE